MKKKAIGIMICTLLIAIVAFMTMNIQLTSAYPSRTSYCNNCHQNDMPTTWITVTEDNQTQTNITYYITGSDNYNGIEGWAVFDSSETNLVHGYFSGSFTLPKDGQTYRLFWVDNGPNKGGSAYEDITTSTNDNNPPSIPEITGPSSGKPGQTLTFIFNAVDPDGDNVRFIIDWGDGQNETTSFTGSGTDKTASHAWSEKGTYTLTIKAEDEYGAIGDKTSNDITIPRNKFVNKPILNWLQSRLNLFPLLQKILQQLGFGLTL
jgi:hypothetical protein